MKGKEHEQIEFKNINDIPNKIVQKLSYHDTSKFTHLHVTKFWETYHIYTKLCVVVCVCYV